MTKNQRGNIAIQAIWIIAGLAVIVAAVFHIVHSRGRAPVEFSTSYQAVLLANGSAYFGHLSGYGTSRPVLTDVYYIVNQTNPETKQSSPVLVKRGKELHEPDRMYLNPTQILFVETVGPSSKVAQLIEQAHH